MLAVTIIESLFDRGIRIWTDGDNIKAHPASALTDDDRDLIRFYKRELLWRINHPEGDPDVGDYQVKVFASGEEICIPLDRLIAEGKAIIDRREAEPSKLFDADMWAASVALARREGRK